MLTMPRVKDKSEKLSILREKYEHYKNQLDQVKQELLICTDPTLKECYEILLDHYGNEAQINLFKIEWIQQLIKEAL